MNELTASDAVARIRAGNLTSEALVGACLARIQARESEVGAWWTALHVPCITVPAGMGPRGLPLGVQFVAAYNAYDLLLRIAEWARRALAAR